MHELWLVLKLLPTNYSFTNHIIYMYKQDLALDNLQCLICCKTQPTKTMIESSPVFTFFVRLL